MKKSVIAYLTVEAEVTVSGFVRNLKVTNATQKPPKGKLKIGSRVIKLVLRVDEELFARPVIDVEVAMAAPAGSVTGEASDVTATLDPS